MQIPKIEDRTAPAKFVLSQADRTALAQLVQSSGYRILLRIMETKCIMQDNRLLSVNVDDEKKIIGEHRVTVAKWEFFAEVQKQVENEVNELLSERDAPKDDRTDEQKFADGVLQP